MTRKINKIESNSIIPTKPGSIVN